MKRAYGALPPGRRGGIEVLTGQLATRLGRSLADAAAPARGLVEDRFHPAPPAIALRPLADSPSQPPGGGDLFGGIALRPGEEARRPAAIASIESLGLLQRIAQRRRQTQAILDQADRDPRTAVRLLAQTDNLIRGLDAASAVQVLYRLADRYAASGQGDLAAETFQMLADEYPDEALARPALVWLVQHNASGEQAERAGDAAGQKGRLDRAIALAALLERTRPDLFAHPAVRFPAAAAYRKQGSSQQAQRLYAMQSGDAGDPWWTAARGELWLLAPKGPPPKPVLPCVQAAVRPRLDGRLDDAVWRQAKLIALHSAVHDDSQWPAAVMLAHDAEFLYLGIRCRQAPGARYEAGVGPRVRDADLSGQDRVDVLIDLDRDFATYYRLTIDHRGWTNDSCCGDSTWDPNWYVAARTEGGYWTVEAAIPLRELTSRPPAAKEAWALGLQRTVPGVGFQSWTVPASTDVLPEGFGYLAF